MMTDSELTAVAALVNAYAEEVRAERVWRTDIPTPYPCPDALRCLEEELYRRGVIRDTTKPSPDAMVRIATAALHEPPCADPACCAQRGG